jgi:hypothetical protein
MTSLTIDHSHTVDPWGHGTKIDEINESAKYHCNDVIILRSHVSLDDGRVSLGKIFSSWHDSFVLARFFSSWQDISVLAKYFRLGKIFFVLARYFCLGKDFFFCLGLIS